MKYIFLLICSILSPLLFAQNPDFRDIKLPKNVFTTDKKGEQNIQEKQMEQRKAQEDSLKEARFRADSAFLAQLQSLPTKKPTLDTQKNSATTQQQDKNKSLQVPEKTKQAYEHKAFIAAVREIQSKIQDLITEKLDNYNEDLDATDDTDFADLAGSEIDEDDGLDLHVRKSLLRKDTTNLYNVDFQNIVLVSEELAIDKVWVTLNQYYQIWDSENINPYKFDLENWKDTVQIQLYQPQADQNWAMPLAQISKTSNFGRRWGRWHHGVDLDLNIGDTVYAAFDGIVRISRYHRGGYGNFVVMRHHNGLETLYAHLNKSFVEVGQNLKAGQPLGEGGSTGRSTGPHLHYEVRYRGYAFNPEEIYDFENQKLRTDIFYLSAQHYEHLHHTQRQVTYHIVEKGETLAKIALRYKTSVRTLCRMNRLSTRTRLYAGRKIRIP